MEAWGESGASRPARAYKSGQPGPGYVGELEDKYLRLKDAHLALKKVAHEQETKIKQMATKLVRLTSDLKKHRSLGGGGYVSHGQGVRDVETESLIGDLQDTISGLKAKNESLAKKLIYYRNQSAKPPQRVSKYDRVAPKTDSGLSLRRSEGTHVPGMVGQRRKTRTRSSRGPVFEDLEVVGGENADPRGDGPSERDGEEGGEGRGGEDVRKMQAVIGFLRSKLLEAEDSLGSLEARNAELERQVEDGEMALAAASNPMHTAALLRAEQKDEMEVVKLEAVVDSLQAQLEKAQAEAASSRAILDPIKANQTALMAENKNLHTQLRSERMKSAQADALASRISILEGALAEAEVMLGDERAAKQSYAEENARLLSTSLFASAQAASQASQARAESAASLADRTHASIVGETKALRDQVQELSGANTELASQLRKAKHELLRKEAEAASLSDQISSISASGVDMVDLQRALALVKAKKAGAQDMVGAGSKVLEFLAPTAPLEDQEETNAGLIRDLTKAHEMLELQMELNAELKATNAELLNDISLVRADYDEQLGVYAAQLDAKNETIARLEDQLASFLYAAPGKRLQRQLDAGADAAAASKLKDSENLLEVVIARIDVASGGPLSASKLPSDASLFVAFDVYDFETMVTPLVPVSAPVFDYTARYVVPITHALFDYLVGASVPLDVYVTTGMDYTKVGSGILSLAPLVDDTSSGSHVPVSIALTGIESGARIGTLRVQTRMLRPMTEALAVYAKRRELVGVLDPRTLSSVSAKVSAVAPENEVSISVLSVSLASPLGSHSDPVLYYQFFNQDRVALPLGGEGSEDPDVPGVYRVSESETFPLKITPELHSYLVSRDLEFVLVDAANPELSAYVGVASAPLAALATPSTGGDGSDQRVYGSFNLFTPSGKRAGSVSVEIEWTQGSYTTPPGRKVHDAETYHPSSVQQQASVLAERTHGEVEDAGPDEIMAAPYFDADNRYIPGADAGLVPLDDRLVIEIGGATFEKGSIELGGELVLMYAFLDEWVEVLPVSSDARSGVFAFGHERTFGVVPGSKSARMLEEECTPEILNDPQSEFGVFEFTLLDVVSATSQREIGLAALPYTTLIDGGDVRDVKLEIAAVVSGDVIGYLGLSVGGVGVLRAAAERAQRA